MPTIRVIGKVVDAGERAVPPVLVELGWCQLVAGAPERSARADQEQIVVAVAVVITPGRAGAHVLGKLRAALARERAELQPDRPRGHVVRSGARGRPPGRPAPAADVISACSSPVRYVAGRLPTR